MFLNSLIVKYIKIQTTNDMKEKLDLHEVISCLSLNINLIFPSLLVLSQRYLTQILKVHFN